MKSHNSKISGSLMFQGTGSDVGKTMLIAALCRAAYHRGLRVLPFKPQNMSNNAAPAEDGEISRAQWLQAYAAKTKPLLDMNPILLKPQNNSKTQVILRGKVFGYKTATEYETIKPQLLPEVLNSYQNLRHQADLVLIEGAGACSEINLRHNDLANMGFAQAAKVPVILVGDIDRGGVIASLVGSHAVLDEKDTRLISGFLINKFRGDPKIFSSAIPFIEERTKWKHYGTIPYIEAFDRLPQEDSLYLEGIDKKQFINSSSSAKIKICVPLGVSAANFDDVDPLRQEPQVELIFVKRGEKFPSFCDAILLLGSKNTIRELELFYQEGWVKSVQDMAQKGAMIIGLCGGYQMLGHSIEDPFKLEGSCQKIKGLGLLNIESKIGLKKTIRQVKAYNFRYGLPIKAYEIHAGESYGADCSRPFGGYQDHFDGAMSKNGKIWGTYWHGIFHNDKFRNAFLQELGAQPRGYCFWEALDHSLDEAALALEKAVNIEQLFALSMTKSYKPFQ